MTFIRTAFCYSSYRQVLVSKMIEMCVYVKMTSALNSVIYYVSSGYAIVKPPQKLRAAVASTPLSTSLGYAILSGG